MTTSILLLAAITAYSPIFNPYANDATWSWEGPNGVVTTMGAPIANENLDLPLVPGVYSPVVGQTGEAADMSSFQCEPIGTVAADPVPLPADISDWDTMKFVYINIQAEGLNHYTWPNDGVSKHTRVLNALKPALELARAVWARDFNVDVKVKHVHMVEDSLGGTAAAGTHTTNIWLNTLNVNSGFVIRLGTVAAARSPLSKPCPVGLVIAQAPFYFSRVTTSSDYYWMVHLFIHETTHGVFDVKHPNCYYINGSPVELCPTGESGCYNGPPMCPPEGTQSFLSYCGCYYDGMAELYGPLHVGPLFGPLARVARANILAAACLTNEFSFQPGTRQSDTADPDEDEIPDLMDNCPDVPNNMQTVTVLTNATHGDACGGCQIIRPQNAVSVHLLLGAVLLVAVRARWQTKGTKAA